MNPREKHPMPQADSLLHKKVVKAFGLYESYFSGDFRFGFSSIKQFRRWFYDDAILRELSYLGMKLVKYEIPAWGVWVGRTQAVFRAEYHNGANKVEEISLTKFLS